MNKIYRIPSKNYYGGESLVSAENAEEANKFISDFVAIDKGNAQDSWGYENVDEDDLIEHLYSDIKGIIHYGIYYRG